MWSVTSADVGDTLVLPAPGRGSRADGLAAVDDQWMAGDKRRLITCEEKHGIGYFLGTTLSMQCPNLGYSSGVVGFLAPGGIVTAGVGRPPMQSCRIDGARADAVHPDVRSVVKRHLAGQIDQRRLGGTVRRALRNAEGSV